MCLAVPGRIERVCTDALGTTMGAVSFGGVVKDVCLAYVDDPEPGQYVIVHAGFAISRLDEAEARRTLALFAEVAAGDEPDAGGDGGGDDALR
jgi:hydrogenase expression/formation protein HypC